MQVVSALLLFVASCSALQLSTPVVAPAPRLAAALRMQVPAERVTESADAAVEGVVVPTSDSYVPVASSAATEALKQRLIAANPDLGQGFKRAEFWSNESTTRLEVLNVLGRFETAEDFKVRTEFAVVENYREENALQGETLQRYEMAQRMGCAERVALAQNAPKRPFTNEKLAASVGLTVADFEGLAVSKDACNVVYDALAESRSTLIPYATITQRRANLLADDGSFNEAAFRTGLYKSRALIIAAWFMFGKGNFVWVLVFAKALHDLRPDIIPSPVDMGLFKIGTFI